MTESLSGVNPSSTSLLASKFSSSFHRCLFVTNTVYSKNHLTICFQWFQPLTHFSKLKLSIFFFSKMNGEYFITQHHCSLFYFSGSVVPKCVHVHDPYCPQHFPDHKLHYSNSNIWFSKNYFLLATAFIVAVSAAIESNLKSPVALLESKYGIVVKSSVFGVGRTWFKSWLYHFESLFPQTSYNFLSLSSFVISG